MARFKYCVDKFADSPTGAYLVDHRCYSACPACGGSGETEKWVLGKSMFLPRHSFWSVVFDGQFYVMSGWVGDGNTDTVEV